MKVKVLMELLAKAKDNAEVQVIDDATYKNFEIIGSWLRKKDTKDAKANIVELVIRL